MNFGRKNWYTYARRFNMKNQLVASLSSLLAAACLFACGGDQKQESQAKEGEALSQVQELVFDSSKFTVETVERGGKTLTYRAFEDIPYVLHPADSAMQKLNIYVPEAYYEGKKIGNYDLHSAPIFLPNSVGGYLPGPREKPGQMSFGKVNATFYALLHGYVVAAPGVRGRGMKNASGENVGAAPAAICDLKAAVRFLRANAGKVPGDVEKIVSNGTSAGGALSALLGTTGNHKDYEAELKKMGAANAGDEIFAASCYCPITNLDHGDMAYEWEFNGQNDFHRTRLEPPAEGETEPKFIPVNGTMSEERKALSAELKRAFPAYLNSLNLKDEAGNPLTLDEGGDGSFKDFVGKVVMASAQRQLERGEDLSGMKWLTIEHGKVSGLDFAKYVEFRTRMKEAPAFDNITLGTAENELFGNADTECRHFTEFSHAHSSVQGGLAEAELVKMMNPMNYIQDPAAAKAKHFRVRHGTVDRDASLAISAMLALKLGNEGLSVDFAYPWGVAHDGDYDLEELFGWIDEIAGGN